MDGPAQRGNLRRIERSPIVVPPQRIIIDSDIGGDVDDNSAIDFAIAEHRKGTMTLLGIVISQIGAASAGAAEAHLLANGMGQIPVYANQAATGPSASTVGPAFRDAWGNVGKLRTAFPEAIAGYRAMLAASPNGSVKICVIGGQSTLSALLQSAADGISPLTGVQLVLAKVAQVIIMGGSYPTSANEANISQDPTAAAYVAANCPVPIIGVGVNGSVLAGPGEFSSPAADPVRWVYNLHGPSNSPVTYHLRRGWDYCTIAYAIDPTLYAVQGGGNGTQTITGSGSVWGNSWAASPAGNYSYTLPANARTLANRIIGSITGKELGRYVQSAKPGFLFDFNETSGLAVVDTTDSGMKGFLGGQRFIADSRAPTRAAAPSGGGSIYTFDGASTFIAVPQSGTWEGTRDICGAVVVNLASVTGIQAIMGNVSTALNGTGFQFRVNGTSLEYYNFSDQGGAKTATFAVGAATGVWVMYGFRLKTVSGSVYVDLYKNGALVYTSTAFTATALLDLNPVPDNPMMIGALRTTLSGGYLMQSWLNGSMKCIGFQAYDNPTATTDIDAMHTSLRAIANAHGITGI